jgi:hypothetical protein
MFKHAFPHPLYNLISIEEFQLLGHYAIHSVESQPTFFLIGLFFNTEDGADMFLEMSADFVRFISQKIDLFITTAVGNPDLHQFVLFIHKTGTNNFLK